MKVNEWKQKGVVSFWCYEGKPRNYSGWHLNCDKEGANSLVDLIVALAESEIGTTRTIKLSAPTNKQLSVPNCREKHKTDKKMVLKLSQEWVITNSKEKITIEFPADMASELIVGVAGIAEGKGDYSIGTQGSKLWFWW